MNYFFVIHTLEGGYMAIESIWERKHQNVLILCLETWALLLHIKFPTPRQSDSLVSFLIWSFYNIILAVSSRS